MGGDLIARNFIIIMSEVYFFEDIYLRFFLFFR